MTWSENLEALKSIATDAAQVVSKKTKELASVAKSNLAIRAEEEKIKKAQLELGKLYYRDYVVGEEPDAAEYLPWCEKITESKEVIEELKSSLEEAKAAESVEFADEVEEEAFADESELFEPEEAVCECEAVCEEMAEPAEECGCCEAAEGAEESTC